MLYEIKVIDVHMNHTYTVAQVEGRSPTQAIVNFVDQFSTYTDTKAPIVGECSDYVRHVHALQLAEMLEIPGWRACLVSSLALGDGQVLRIVESKPAKMKPGQPVMATIRAYPEPAEFVEYDARGFAVLKVNRPPYTKPISVDPWLITSNA